MPMHTKVLIMRKHNTKDIIYDILGAAYTNPINSIIYSHYRILTWCFRNFPLPQLLEKDTGRGLFTNKQIIMIGQIYLCMLSPPSSLEERKSK